jgi:hypothetical protein
MTGTIAGPSDFTLELVGTIVGLSMIVGAFDVIRQPGWAWKRAEESKIAYLALVLLLPLVGLAMYVFSARPNVAPITAGGRAASLPFERFGEEAGQKQREEQRQDGWPIGTIAPPAGFGSFGAATATGGGGGGGGAFAGGGGGGGAFAGGGGTPVSSGGGPEDGGGGVQVAVAVAPVETAATFFSAGGSTTRLHSPMGLARAYRPRQRASLAETDEAPPTVPAGWKADPTGRHQFRYWDGFQWTENVADAGAQSRDSVSA